MNENSVRNGSDSGLKFGCTDVREWNVGKLDDLVEEFKKGKLDCVGCFELSWRPLEWTGLKYKKCTTQLVFSPVGCCR
ncbi:hypothetical protein FHG87_004051 [Trinorchestia longiramus]|nr:hypothetical protein FHG87_004051 [Trinorchestia longiramus]